jgi:hypothetical protein
VHAGVRSAEVEGASEARNSALARVLSFPYRFLAVAARLARYTLIFIGMNPIIAATLVGVLIFAAVRLVEVSFYGEFGIRPEEVGLGYKETLQLSTGFVALVVLCAALLMTAALGVCFAWWIVIKVLRLIHVVRRTVRCFPRGSDFAAFCAVYGTAAAVVIVGVWQAVAATGYARSAKKGHKHEPGVFGGLLVTPAHVTWFAGKPPNDLRQAARGKLMYLGKAQGAYVLYSVKLKETIEVPTNAAVISIDKS